ncbi:FKBP-type peptidyl-prolyl cis-trans isomerase [Pseudomonas sp. NCCP-436]|uniref:FKBP-type peptidyl-prolyl cis-trans isomerase n=1 Tax=Pseudomonas sp. NCCP-436 TaxID=2842481 RepID=UPI001C7EA00C|nr:FKBP-type peptidyl-prolyl cis-trans isomerase [Pseudomonas sp. NCCP-436]GIZ10872.1 putative FKBP-type 25 kDa peptidyl-prolyl cis-trans isomerase [Pseudomonas sp. NCCP-436]
MKRILPAVVLLCCSLPAGADPLQRDLAYSLGVRLGERLQAEMPELPLEDLLDGLRQAYRDEPLRLPPEHIERLLEAHEARLAANLPATNEVIAAEQRFLSSERARAGARELEGGIIVNELRTGNGPRPSPGSRVLVHYRGTLANGEVFDESESPQWFRLDSLISGWQTALRQMPKGSRWRLAIPSAQAYGRDGAGELIPPHSPLLFELELIEIAD